MTEQLPVHGHRGRLCFYVNPHQDPEEHGGFVPSAVYANEPGHSPVLDEFDQLVIWGETLADAKGVCEKANDALGLEPKDVDKIIARSMLLSRIN